MSPMKDDDRPLGSLFGDWQAEEPPEGFASAVVRSFESERRKAGSRWATRGVVVPLLLAAVFISWGAAAAFSERALRTAELGQEETTETAPKAKEAPRLSFYSTLEPSSAEPDPLIEPSRNVRPEMRPEAPSGEVEEAERLAAETPRVIHFPRCECGTSDVVCTCSD